MSKRYWKKFNMDKAYLARTPMVVRALEKDTDPFRLKEEGEEVLGQEYPYLSAIGALMYLANNTRPDIDFAVNCLARYSTTPTMHHWNDIKNMLRYLVGTIYLVLHFQNDQDSKFIGYANTGYLSDPLNARSQTEYLFLHGGTTISWKSCKQTLVATSKNHSEIIALYKASRECAWLRRMGTRGTPGAALCQEVGAGAPGTCGAPEAALSREVGAEAPRTCGAPGAALRQEVGVGASGARGAPGAAPPPLPRPFMHGQGVVVPVTPIENSHRMITRGKTGFRVVLDRLVLNVATPSPTSSLIPSSAHAALADPHWLAAMEEEYGALISNGT
jgi:hypothetical protein